MSRLFYGSMLAFALVASPTFAEDAKTEGSAKSCDDSCLKSGDSIGAFYVTKVAGAEEDGVDQGQELCYRCRYGSRPMVMVFARNTGGKMPELVRQLDSAVAENEDANLKGLITLLGENTDSLKADAEKLAQTASAKHVPLVIAKDNATGPSNYKIPADAVIMVIVANDSQIVSTKTFAADSIDIASIMDDVKGMLN